MKFIITEPKLNVYQPHNLNENSELAICTNGIKGSFSNNITIWIDSNGKDAKTEGWVAFDLNKNEARYLCNILKSFINEAEIDIEAED